MAFSLALRSTMVSKQTERKREIGGGYRNEARRREIFFNAVFNERIVIFRIRVEEEGGDC